jgi:hypothetical protein
MRNMTLVYGRKQIRSLIIVQSAVLSALALVVVAQLTRIGIDWSAAHGSMAKTTASESTELNSLTLTTVPLRGLSKRTADTHQQIESFYSQRIPANYSTIVARIDEIGVQSGVRLLHVTYTQHAGGEQLTEISIDSGISGDYPKILRFVNLLERDPIFFVIKAMTLNGQQGGIVDLQLQFSAWLRPAQAAASGLPFAANDESMPNPQGGTRKE